jgi:hypothetical protein
MQLTIISLFLFISKISALGQPCIGAEGTFSPNQPQWWTQRHQSLLAQTAQHKANIQIVFIGDSKTDYWSTTGRETWHKFYAPRGAYNYGILLLI